MNTYSFYLEGGFRKDIEASTPQAGLRKIVKFHGEEKDFKGNKIKDIITASFIKYNKQGLGDYNFNSTEETRKVLDTLKQQKTKP